MEKINFKFCKGQIKIKIGTLLKERPNSTKLYRTNHPDYLLYIIKKGTECELSMIKSNNMIFH